MVKGKNKYTSRKRKYYRSLGRKKFFKISSDYKYQKINLIMYIKPYVVDPMSNPALMTAYKIGKSGDQAMGNASAQADWAIPKLLHDSGEFTIMKTQYSAYRIRSCSIKIWKIYDPRSSTNQDCDLQSPILLFCNLNRATSTDQLNYGEAVKLTGFQNYKSIYITNKVKDWNRTDYNSNDVGTWGDNNNGHIQVLNNETENKNIAVLRNYPTYYVEIIFYILFKSKTI